MNANLRRLTRKGLLRRKKSSLAMLAVCTLSFFFVLSILILQSSLTETELRQRERAYGAWEAAVFTDDAQTENAVVQQPMVERSGKIEVRATYPIGNMEGNGTIGAMDSQAAEIGKLELAEGHLPKRRNEIAVEMSTLTKMGYDYTLGQKISVCLNYQDPISKEEKSEQRVFILSGILKDYSMYWMEGRYDWPTAFAKGEDLPKEQKERILLVDISEKYYGAVTDLEAFCKDGTIYNENTYYELSGKEQKVSILEDTNVLLAVLCAASALMILQIFSATLRRREVGYRMLRVIGADKRQLQELILWEGGIFWGISFLTGSILGVAGTYFLVWGIRERLHFEIVFAAEPGQIFIGILSVSVSIWLAIGCSVMRMQRGKRPENISEQKRLSMIRKRQHRFRKKEVWSREHALHPYLWTFSVVSTFLCVCMIYSVTAVVKNRADSYGYQWTPDYIGRGILPEHMLREEIPTRMKAVQGVKEVNTLQKAYPISLTWEEMEETQYVKLHRNLRGQEGQRLETQVLGVERGEKLFQKYAKEQAKKTLKEEAFWNGEEILIYLPVILTDREGNAVDRWEEPFPLFYQEHRERKIREGDTLTLTGAGGEKSVRVGGIIREFQARDAYVAEAFSEYTVIAAGKLVQELNGMGKEKTYSYVEGFADRYGDTHLTDREMSVIMKEVEKEFPKAGTITNERIRREQLRKDLFASMFGAVFLLVVIVILSWLIQWQMARAKAAGIGKKVGILKALGIPKRRLCRVYWKETMKIQLGAILSVIPCGVLLQSFLYWKRLEGLAWGDGWQPPQDLYGWMEQIIFPTMQRTAWGWLALIFLGYLLVVVYISYRPYWKEIHRGVIENLREE